VGKTGRNLTRVVFCQIFPLGFFGAPHVNDQRSSPVPRLAQLRRYYTYLQSLGINCVYFAPLFESSSHGCALSSSNPNPRHPRFASLRHSDGLAIVSR
jgi:hypothetical protein